MNNYLLNIKAVLVENMGDILIWRSVYPKIADVTKVCSQAFLPYVLKCSTPYCFNSRECNTVSEAEFCKKKCAHVLESKCIMLPQIQVQVQMLIFLDGFQSKYKYIFCTVFSIRHVVTVYLVKHDF